MYNGASLTPSGPPTPPEPTLTVVNDTLKFSWAPAWSWDSHPVTHYTVTLTNNTDGSVYTNQSNETAWYFTREEGAGPRCDVMVVNVTATNDIGDGEAGQLIGGFPIRKWFIFITCQILCKIVVSSVKWKFYFSLFRRPTLYNSTPPVDGRACMCAFDQSSGNDYIRKWRDPYVSSLTASPQLPLSTRASLSCGSFHSTTTWTQFPAFASYTVWWIPKDSMYQLPNTVCTMSLQLVMQPAYIGAIFKVFGTSHTADFQHSKFRHFIY